MAALTCDQPIGASAIRIAGTRMRDDVLARLATPKAPSALSDRVANAMASGTIPACILLARRDGTALAFTEAWQSPAFGAARKSGLYRITTLDSSAHSFARADDYAALKSALLESLSGN
jgi:hypothetical protein